MRVQKQKDNRIGVAHVLFFYWVILIAWQNLSRSTAMSGSDLLIKIALIFALTAFYLFRTRQVSKKIIIILLLALSLLLSFWLSGDSSSGRVLITYIYPVLLALLSFGIGDDFQINKRDLYFFLNGVIVVTLYMAVYALLFCTSQFLGALGITSAYGNELSSFLYSCHEYGMYLAYAIIACILCIDNKKNEPPKKKIHYVFAIAFLGVNLFLTFSRTALLALAVFVFVYCFFYAGTKLRKWMVFVGVVFVVLIIGSEQLRSFLKLLLFKNTDGIGTRETLYRLAIDLFREGNAQTKIFGYGFRIRETFMLLTGLNEVHNAYLQVLLYFGVSGVIFLAVLLLGQLMMSVRLFRYSRFYATAFCALLVSAMALMFTNTAIVFTSPVDSFFLTIFTILVPKYVRNAIVNDAYDVT